MKVDYVIKVGGSILYDVTSADLLLDMMYKNKEANYVLTVGSGYLGEMYKDFVYSRNNLDIPFDDSVRDYANIQSINATVLASINNNFVVCESKEAIELALEQGKIPIADARGFLNVYRHERNQKSDVRSANICKELGCENLIVVTNVAGIFDTDPNKTVGATQLPMVSAEDLAKMGRTSVDEGLAEKIIEYDLNCCVVGIENLIMNYGKIDSNLIETGTVIKSLGQKGKESEEDGKSRDNWMW